MCSASLPGPSAERDPTACSCSVPGRESSKLWLQPCSQLCIFPRYWSTEVFISFFRSGGMFCFLVLRFLYHCCVLGSKWVSLIWNADTAHDLLSLFACLPSEHPSHCFLSTRPRLVPGLSGNLLHFSLPLFFSEPLPAPVACMRP